MDKEFGVPITNWLSDAITNFAANFLPTPWVEKFAWLPIPIKGERIWFKKYYVRTVVVTYNNAGELKRIKEYGTIFDVLKDE